MSPKDPDKYHQRRLRFKRSDPAEREWRCRPGKQLNPSRVEEGVTMAVGGCLFPVAEYPPTLRIQCSHCVCEGAGVVQPLCWALSHFTPPPPNLHPHSFQAAPRQVPKHRPGTLPRLTTCCARPRPSHFKPRPRHPLKFHCAKPADFGRPSRERPCYTTFAPLLLDPPLPSGSTA
jgi:hypothetical protein